MKINGMSGDFGFKALVFYKDEWLLTGNYYFSLEEVKKYHGNRQVKWPVEVYDNESVYVAGEEELK